jgi:hypothetical protein
MTPTVIAVYNQSSKVTDEQVQDAIAAIGIQLSRDVAPFWGNIPALEFVPKDGTPSPNSCPCTLSDTPDQPGALGYHDEGTDGVPYIKVFVVDGYDWVTTLSHEILELTGNPAANRWCDSPDGSDYAQELCDAVEGDSYSIDGLNVSNFVLPAFFDPNTQPGERLDVMGNLTAPFTMTPGGYEIHRTEPGEVSQEFARITSGAGRTSHYVGDGIIVVFGEKYPNGRKVGKLRQATRFGESRRYPDWKVKAMAKQRVTPPPAKPPVKPPTTKPASDKDAWSCRGCGTGNPGTALTCRACGMNRHA